jgi:hypothetical protein
VQEAALQGGETVHLGSLEMKFESDTPSSDVIRIAPKPAALSVRLATAEVPDPTVHLVQKAPPPIPVPVPVPTSGMAQEAPPANAAAALAGSKNCKFHPRAPGRFLCHQCHHLFCELCVTTRNVGGAPRKFCRTCGVECVPVQVQTKRVAGPGGFFARLPGVFIYPFRGSGLMILIGATLVFAVLNFISGVFALLATIIAVGYLFSFMQNIIHCTAAEDEQMPDLPEFDGLFSAFLTLAGTVAFCFALPIGLALIKYYFEVDIPSSVLVAALILSCLYFPMGFLAVAMKDSVMAANPLIVVPAILQVPLEYAVTSILLAGVFGARLVGRFVMFGAQAEGFATHDMSILFLTFGLRALLSFVSVYLLTVGMRILGVLYVTKKDKLGWFST